MDKPWDVTTGLKLIYMGPVSHKKQTEAPGDWESKRDLRVYKMT